MLLQSNLGKNSSITNPRSVKKATEEHFTALFMRNVVFSVCDSVCVVPSCVIHVTPKLLHPSALDTIASIPISSSWKCDWCAGSLEHSLQFLVFPLLTSFLEVCVSNSFKFFLAPLYHWGFSLGPSAVPLLTFHLYLWNEFSSTLQPQEYLG